VKIILYDEGTSGELDLTEIARYTGKKLGKVEVELRESLFAADLSPEIIAEYARKIAGAKVQDVSQRMEAAQEPLYGEVEFEKRRITGKSRAFGVLYDGGWLRSVFSEAIPAEKRQLDCLHIIFTNRMFGSWDDHNKRYHLRTSLYSVPSIISTTGIIEAPARPREYYVLKQQYQSLGKDPTALKESFQGRFIDYEDERLTEVTKGYVVQAVVYHLTGDPFCEDRGCRLYNAHWQEDLIYAQLESGYEFCTRHEGILGKAGENNG
jgi:hypothetical protein